MTEITINPNRIDLDEAYLQMAEVWAKRSKGNRLQVGALIVKDRQIISDGYNGMPAGSKDDVCEYFANGVNDEQGLTTKREVLHAESNALMKIAENGGVGAQGATIYTTWSPCFECAKLIRQAKVVRLVFRNAYRDMDGVQFLIDNGVIVEQIHGTEAPQRAPAPPPPPLVKPTPPPGRIMRENEVPARPSVLAQIAGGDQFAHLRSPRTPPPPPPMQVAPIEPSSTSPVHVESVVVDEPFVEAFAAVPLALPDGGPMASDDEVAALLRAHEAAVNPSAATNKPTEKPPADGPYSSSFL